MNRINLEKLARHLASLPADYEHFDMFDYARYEHPYTSGRSLYPDELSTDPVCGTVACAAGHGPMAGIAARPDETWSNYERRVFDLTDAEWGWCFASEWRFVDNTPLGAAKRIRHLLLNGVPHNAVSQRDGTAPYMFADTKELTR